MPVANQGLEAAALAKLAVLAQQIQVILAGLPAGGDAARDVREALNKIAKHVAPGSTNRGVEMTEAQRALMQQRQMGPQIAALRAAQAGGGGAGGPGAAPPGMGPPPAAPAAAAA